MRVLVPLALLAAGLLAGPAAARAQAPLPDSMAATGDSITRAFNAGLRPFADSPVRSWATGADADVASVYRRIARRNPRARARPLNVARSGARLADVRRQAAALRGARVEYVTVLVGANDVCAPSEAEMTPVAAFREELALALAALHAEAPGARVSVLSIPDVGRLFALGRGSPATRTAWAAFGICRALFARATSPAAADRARRARVIARLGAFNLELEAACLARPWCSWDGGAVFRFPFERRHVSRRDFFHPSELGQRALADVAWRAAFPDRSSALTPAP